MANLSGMFEQLNAAVLGNPLAGDAGGKLLSGFSQGMGGALGAAFDTDKYGFMTAKAKEAESQRDMMDLDLTKSSGMAQAAQLYQKRGDAEKAVLMAAKAKEMAQAEAKGVTEKRQMVELMDIVKADSTLTTDEREYFQAAIVNGAIKTRADYLTAKRGAATGDLSILKGGMIKDEEGNIFNTITVTDENTGLPTTRYSVVGEGPAEPKGKVTPISPTTGQDGQDTHDQRMTLAKFNSLLRMSEDELQAELKKGNIDYQTAADVRKARAQSNIDLEEQWATDRNEIVMNLPNVMLAADSAEKALGLLSTNDTSGVLTSIASIADFFGIADTSDHAQLNQAMSTYVLENLRKMGANPTEGERQFLIDAAANISRGTEANVALFEKTLKRLKMNGEASRFLLENPAATRDEYVTKYNTMIEAQASKRTIRLGDMD